VCVIHTTRSFGVKRTARATSSGTLRNNARAHSGAISK